MCSPIPDENLVECFAKSSRHLRSNLQGTDTKTTTLDKQPNQTKQTNQPNQTKKTKQTNKQTNQPTNQTKKNQTNKQANKQASKQTNKQTNKQTPIQPTNKQSKSNKQTNKHRYKQKYANETNKQTQTNEMITYILNTINSNCLTAYKVSIFACTTFLCDRTDFQWPIPSDTNQ
jgi:hypothetical protein